MKESIDKNSQLLFPEIQGESKRSSWNLKRIQKQVIQKIALALFIWLPMFVNAAITLPAIPSNVSLANRFELSTEMIIRVKIGETYLTGGALVASVNGEVRGAQMTPVIFPATGNKVYKVLVFNDKPSGDSISFKYYDIPADKIYDIKQKIEFVFDLVPDFANPVILTAFCKPLTSVTGLIPENGKENQNTTVDLFWQPSPNTASYNLFVWEDGTTMPVAPTNPNISATTFRLSNLKYGQLYRWKIGTFNECSSVESAVQTFRIILLPDLTVSNVLAPTNIESGSIFNVSFNVSNIGGGSTAGVAWSDAVYVSTDQTLSVDDKLLSTTANIKQLKADSSYTQSVSVSLPNEYSGDYYFLVKTDVSNSVSELLEDNNLGKTSAVTHVALKSLPDILVKDIQAGSANVNPGDSLTVSWKVQNIATVAAVGGWAERISFIPVSGPKLTIDPSFQYMPDLAAGATLNRTKKIKLPELPKFSGDANIEVELIPLPALQEYPANKANNKATSASQVTVGNLLTLSIQTAAVLENTATPVRCIITRSGDYSADLPVNLSASLAGQVTIPATVTIPANQSSVVFNLSPINNLIIDGPRNVDISASATDYINSTKTITILDDEIPGLTAHLSKSSATEGETITLTVTRDLVTSLPLSVNFSTNKPSQWTFPSTLIIPANQASGQTTVSITDDNIPELTSDATIYANSAGLTSSQVTASIIDNDIPEVSLQILTDTVSESGGIYATWGVIKRVKGTDNITVNLTASLSDQLFFPASIVLPKGALEQKFNIGVIDNAIVDGFRRVTLTGSVLISSCNCRTTAQNGGVVNADLVIADNDGPSLSVSIDPISLPEGKLNAGTLTITRNTPTDLALDVNISYNDTSQVKIQATAKILAGQRSVQVPIDTKNDHIQSGSQMASIQASAATFTTGFGYFFVTDQNKPDLQITDIALNVNTAATNDVIEISGSAFNGGFATAPSGVGMNFYFSKDKTLDDSDIPLGDFTFTSPILQGAAANFMKTVDVPNQTGSFYILAKINPTETLTELVYFNNVSDAVPLTITPEYNATAIADNTLYLPNTTITIHGSALNKNSEKVPNADIDVYILTNGTRRELKAKTDNSGNYSVDFVPIPNETGHFVIGACYPKQNLSDSQDAFDIPGLQLTTTSNIIWEMKLGQILFGKIAVRNTSEAPLNHIVILPDKLPLGCDLKFDTIAVLSANQTLEFHYTLKATELTNGTNYENIKFHVQSAEGVAIDFPAYYYCQALQGQLKSDPVAINTTMTKGKSRQYELHIYNNGAGQTGTVTVGLPNVSWMSLVSSATIPNIAPQDTATVILNLSPTSDMPLNTPISGNIAVNCVNGNGVQVPYQFEVVSQEKGGLKVDVLDEYSYYTEAKPHLKNAHVVVRHPFSGKILAEGFTGDDGTFKVDSLPEGSYKMSVEADKHEGFQTVIAIDPGRVNEQSVFLSFQAITYTWEVVPTQIQDKYDVQLVMKYETNVPVPVVVVDMPTDMPQLVNDQTYPFLITLTNKGLITAKDVDITLPQNDPEYEFILNFTKTDLMAQQAIQVPVVMQRRAGLKSATTTQTIASSGPCTDYEVTIYGWECGENKQWNKTGHNLTFSGRSCGGSSVTTTGPSGGTPWFNGWFWPLVPNRTTGGHYWFNPIVLPGAGVGSSTAGCDPCLLDLGLGLAGCLPIIGTAANTVGCIKTFVGFSGISWGFAADVGLCIAGFIQPVDCLAGLVGALKTCGIAAYHSLKSASIIGSTQGTISKYPIIQQAFDDMAYLKYLNDAQVAWMNEVVGSMDWQSKQSFNDFIKLLVSVSVKNQPIDPSNVALLKEKMIGTDISADEIDAIVTRWNNSVVAFNLGIYSPTPEYPGIIDNNLLASYVSKADSTQNYALSKGYGSVGELYNASQKILKAEVETGRNSVCASVTINITQKVVMTREAFEGTLTIFNGHTTEAMKEIKLNLDITDENGVPSNNLFQIDTKALSILTGIDGTGTLGAQQKGSVTVIFIPEKGAAPTVPKSYSFGGSFSYLDPFTGVTVTKPLFPVTLDVNPSPDLWLHYFMQRDILGDDPLTPAIEPIVPAELAVMVQNNGYGTANGVHIESAQPKIVENAKGLAINFALIGSNLNGQPRQLGLTNIDFGNIAPKKAAIGQWYFTSDLMGHFVSYDAKVSHIDSRGNPDLSLISGATLHELIKSVDVYSGVEDGINDFLVNEVQDALEFPDVIYLSNGGVLDVYPAISQSTSGNIASANHELELLVTPKQIGWNYIKFSDPGGGNYKIASVTREDGQIIPLDNVWQTFVTMPDSKEPVYENMIHFLDVFVANSTQKYTIRFTAKDQNPPAIVRFDHVPAAAATSPVTSVNVVFNRPIDPSTFNYEDMTLRIQGGADVMDNTVTITKLDSVTYKIDLTTKSLENGYYVLTVQTSQISSLTGTSGLVGKQATWTQFINVPAVSEFIGLPDNKVGPPFDLLLLRFNLPIDQSTLSSERFSLKKDGKTVSGTLTVTPMDTKGILFQLSGLKDLMSQDGKYTLTVDLPNIKTIDGNNGILIQSTQWKIDQTAPLVSQIIPSSDGGYDSQHRTAFTVQFDEPVKGFGVANLELWKAGIRQPLSQLDFTTKSDSEYLFTQFRMLTYYDGNYQLKVKMKGITDLAGNSRTDTVKYNWIVSRSIPKAVTNLHITPDMGFSDNDGVTATRSLNAVMTVNEPNSRIQIYQTDRVNPILLADVSNVNTGLLSLPVKLNYGGNMSLQAYSIDSYTNQIVTEIPLFIDEAGLVGTWKNAPAAPVTIQPTSLQLEFSDKLLDDILIKDALKFERDGQSLGTENLTILKSTDKLYVVSGMDQAGNAKGIYSLTLDLSKLAKYNSGKEGVGTSKVNWTVSSLNTAPNANAGIDQTVNENTLVTLDGSGSSDANNDALTYLWTAPAGITLSSVTDAKPTFTAPLVNADQTYTFDLVVNDGKADSQKDQVIVTVKNINKAPVANAGSDLTVSQGATVSLDGTASTDPDGNPLTYRWTAPAGITFSSATAAKPTFTAPAVTINTSYTIILVVNDGTVDSPADQVVITIKTSNSAPVANAGSDQMVNKGATVMLDGTASSDPDGNPLTYRWTVPSGITLSSATDAKPTFTAPNVTINTSYTLTLKVNDGLVDSPADQVIITVKASNSTPVANAGADQTTNEGSIVTLDGTGSTDPDGNPLTYKWTVPNGITLSSTTAAKPTFTAPEVSVNTSYTLTLVVNDGLVNSPADQVIITVKQVNKAPIANAGPDQSVYEGQIITLDGSASSDPDSNPLTYKWTVPAGITLNSANVAKPTFTAPAVTINTSYTFTLVVNDGLVDSPADQLVITVFQANKGVLAFAGPDQTVNEGAIVTLDGSASKDPNNNPLTYKWTVPAGIVLSSTTVATPTFTAPEVNINTSYTIVLVVNNGLVDSPADQVIITIKQVNKAPLANAGPDQSVNENTVVTLDGSASTDPDGNPLTYKWTVPAGITLSSTTVSKPTFTAPKVGVNTSYTISLVVNDGLVDSPADQVVITVLQVDKGPLANAGPDQSVNEGDIVTLDGSASADPNSIPLTYKWTTPAGIILSSKTAASPTFTAPEVSVNTSYTIILVVNNGLVDSPADQVVITVKQVNKPPVANAGPDQSINEGTVVTLDGSASSDPDGNALTYQWTAPSGITLSSTTAAKPTFTAPDVYADQGFTFSLIVNDGLVNSTTSQVLITVKNVANTGIQTIKVIPGWNIFSANVIPANLNMKDIFQPLIDAGKLTKVMDQAGNALVDLGFFGGWTNKIGNLSIGKGYKVYTTEPVSIILQGTPVPLPMDISLSAGWNIIAYPSDIPLDAMTVFQTLIDQGKLIKVMDESGLALEDFGILGGWKNNIGNLNPNKGYKVNMLTAGILTIPASGTKSSVIVPEVLASTHFQNVFIGNGTDHMNINLVDLAKSGFVSGDELGIFDGIRCVGSAQIGPDQMTGNFISISASSNDELQAQADGYISGNAVSIHLYRNNQEYLLQAELLKNSQSNFVKGESMFARANTSLATKINVLSDSGSVKCYPNPFTDKLTIEVDAKDAPQLDIRIFDISGRLIRNLYQGNGNEMKHLVWDGKSDDGLKMIPGNYFLKANDTVKKIMLSR